MADSTTRLLGLLGGLAMLGLLTLGLRWTFGTGRNLHVPDPDDPTGDGLLTEVSRVPTQAAVQVLRGRLLRAGIRATVSRAEGGYRLLVFREDVVNAKIVLSRGSLE